MQSRLHADSISICRPDRLGVNSTVTLCLRRRIIFCAAAIESGWFRFFGKNALQSSRRQHSPSSAVPAIIGARINSRKKDLSMVGQKALLCKFANCTCSNIVRTCRRRFSGRLASQSKSLRNSELTSQRRAENIVELELPNRGKIKCRAISAIASEATSDVPQSSHFLK